MTPQVRWYALQGPRLFGLLLALRASRQLRFNHIGCKIGGTSATDLGKSCAGPGPGREACGTIFQFMGTIKVAAGDVLSIT
jgi:hypothetical protein